MGTRCDFYVGRGLEAEWLGSLAWDGYRIAEMEKEHATKNDDNAACWAIKSAHTEEAYRAAVALLLSLNESATLPKDGWPWPWEDSRTTDYSYAFDGDKTFVSVFGHTWFDPMVEREDDDDEDAVKAVFPNMTAIQKVDFGKRSGLMIVQG